MDLDQMKQQLLTMRRALEAPWAAAKAAGNTAEMQRLEAIAKDIDELRIDAALIGLAQLATEVTKIRARIDGHQANLDDLTGGPLSRIKQQIQDIFAQTAEEDVTAPPVAVTTRDAPVVAAPTPAAPAPTPGTPTPPPAHTGQLVLTDAHLIGLWRRSLFPIDDSRITVFGLRGCRPVDFSGTALAAGHEIVLTPVDYQVMKCTLGHWHPGKGLALFPGSTVPYGAVVASKRANNGVGVNQMGRGRYSRYVGGWHKRSEGPNGHWALRQECAITIQRTGDDTDFDLNDRWEVGRIAGDNIHCAFHMGVDGNPADAKFSSAGCQTVAGTLRKGVRGSELGPYKDFIAPFTDALGTQKETQYVLFGAEEAQMMIRTHCAGKTVLLRFGSFGPLVEDLQRALNLQGAHLKVDGDFGPGTFVAVTDFQTRSFGPSGDDGIVGPGTAAKLGLTLPIFDFDDAVRGGPGHTGPSGPPAGAGTSDNASLFPGAVPPVASPGTEIAFGAVTRAKHGQAFNDKVIAIAARLKCDPNHLMAVMAFETGERFTPDVKNAAGSGATGLIQFMPKTAIGLGTTTAKLAQMSAIDQLDFVEAHFKSVVGRRAMPALSDVYMAVLLPSAVGKLDSHVLFAKGTRAYDQNKGLDKNKNGKITKAEAAGKVQLKLELGMKNGRFG
ncbi:peptidoglycan-binding protein [uncultured Tateyamaria sp.]|uniref:peptidoglycan-binding protein n=2 Tax=uncultured Tateyamaria sp. TaxID=455651 RepID=UPI002633CF57|nr:peptidoglycan-binding protein [uncultured Tateyamaria sp.]